MSTRSRSPRPALARAAAACACGAAAVLAACSTQRWPGPMRSTAAAREPVPAAVQGPTEVLVLRHADPVEVRPIPGGGSWPLYFYSKKERLRSGASVLTGAGGRAEILWPGRSASFLLIGEAVCEIGEPTRDEPALALRGLSNARVFLTPDLRVRLLGGSVLSGDPGVDRVGPIFLEHRDSDVLRVHNQAKTLCTIEFRDERIDLGPGQVVDLALLGAGGEPFELAEGASGIGPPAQGMSASGSVEAVQERGGLRLLASGPARVQGRGQVVRLAAGEEAFFGPPDARASSAPSLEEPSEPQASPAPSAGSAPSAQGAPPAASGAPAQPTTTPATPAPPAEPASSAPAIPASPASAPATPTSAPASAPAAVPPS